MFFGHDKSPMIPKDMVWIEKYVLLGYTFPTRYRMPQIEIICKSYALGKLMYQLPPSRPANLLAFHLSGLGFWIFFMLKGL
jgi:hypothetical protein